MPRIALIASRVAELGRIDDLGGNATEQSSASITM
jgi:hypothetical protein